jgi:hypothetical protein
MSDYDQNFRALDCWDCFEAQGKTCHNRDASKHKELIGKDSNFLGVCCKPGSTDKECMKDKDQICSEPAHLDDTSSDY